MERSGGTSKNAGRTKKEGETDSITKNYPWLACFDEEAKAYFAAPEVTVGHVLKLITLLESHVSPEVSKLKTRPNRATKFLTQIRKKISLVKVSSLMIEPDLEKSLFPTYGLLMTHIVNISLASSKVERLGAQNVATELYYLLKLMFQGQNEYILDVALCSNLDEHASSKDKVGFQFFSFIVEDWRLYSDTHSSKMKYCAICSVLSAACQAGQQMVERNVSTEKPSTLFLEFLSKRKTLDTKFEARAKTEKPNNLKAIIKHIKPTFVKSISRGRLVVVSKRDISGGRRERSGSSDSSSSTVNMPSTSSHSGNFREIPSSSVYSQQVEDPMNDILGELGLGGGFFLDTTGHDADNYYESDSAIADYTNQNDQVSSSSTRRKSSSSAADKRNLKRESDSETSEDETQNNILDNGKSFNYSPPEREDSPSSMLVYTQQSPSSRRSSDRVAVAAPDRNSKALGSGSRRVLKRNKDYEEEEEEMKSDSEMSDPSREGTPFEPEVDDDGEKSLMSVGADATTISSKKAEEVESDSDLEVVTIIDPEGDGKDTASMTSDGSRSRDEEEAESGEDVVPNYDIDSDVEENDDLADSGSAVPGTTTTEQGSGTVDNNNLDTKNEESEDTNATDTTATTNNPKNIEENTVSLNSDTIFQEVDNMKQGANQNDETNTKRISGSPLKGKKQETVKPEPRSPTSPCAPKRARLSRASTNALQNSHLELEKLKSDNSADNSVEVSSTPATRGRTKNATNDSTSTVPPVETVTPVRRSSRLRK